MMSRGYVFLYRPEHPRADTRGYVREHVLVAEAALGRHLDQPNEVHHVNGVRSENGGRNLVICEDRAYHMLLEVRTRALKTCGHADWRPCTICKNYDDPATMAVRRGFRGRADRFTHARCNADYQAARYHARKGAA